MKTAVIGASGYAGGELLRLLATHPVFEVAVVSAHSNAGEQVTSVHPQLQSYAGREFVTADSIDFAPDRIRISRSATWRVSCIDW
jgi:N-acetyl-gamma-glutamyl-phosphate reductase